MPYSPNQILGLPEDFSDLLRFRRKYRPRPRKIRPRRTGGELLEYLRKTGIRSSRRLMALRKDGDPIVWDYRREFGSWSKAVEQAFGRELQADFDPRYLLKTVIEFNLWSQRAYQRARNKAPHIFPSVKFIIKMWRTWANFMKCAQATSLDAALDKYRKLERRLGHRPTMRECRVRGVLIEEALRRFGGKHTLDELLSGAERQRERRDGNP